MLKVKVKVTNNSCNSNIFLMRHCNTFGGPPSIHLWKELKIVVLRPSSVRNQRETKKSNLLQTTRKRRISSVKEAAVAAKYSKLSLGYGLLAHTSESSNKLGQGCT